MKSDGEYPVSLNVYDISGGWAKKLSGPVIGKEFEAMYHTGVVVFGMEYFWAADLMCMPAGRTPYGTPLRNVPLGTTHLPRSVVDEYVDSLRPQYNVDTYSLLTKNCNNFSNELSLFLVGHGIPPEILHLPQDILSTPVGAAVRPILESIESQQKAWALQQQQQQQQSYHPNIFYPPSFASPPPPKQSPQQKPLPPKQPKPSVTESERPLISYSCNPRAFTTKLRSTGSVNAGVIWEIRDAILDPTNYATGLSGETHAFFEKALSTWPLSECVAPLFLLRGLALHSFFPAHYFTPPSAGGRPPAVDEARAGRLFRGLERLVAAKDKSSAVLAMAALMNLFATPAGEALAKTPDVLRSVFALTLDELDNNDPQLREAAAALAYNYACTGPFADQALGATCLFRLSVATVKKYPKKCDSQEAKLYTLAALRSLLTNNPLLVASASKNAQLTTHIMELAKARGSHQNKTASIAKELCTIMSVPQK